LRELCSNTCWVPLDSNPFAQIRPSNEKKAVKPRVIYVQGRSILEMQKELFLRCVGELLLLSVD
jgi:hypothetical protein